MHEPRFGFDRFATKGTKGLTASAILPSGCPWPARFYRFFRDFLALCTGAFYGCVMGLLLRTSRLLERSCDQVVTRARTVHERENMIVRISFTNDFDTSRPLQTSELFHHKRLLRGAHVAVIDIESETGRMWRRIDDYCVAVHSAQRTLILLWPHQRTHRQPSRELSVISRCHFFQYPQRRDRKSTRLNSSHSQISYAVLCLKKKKTQN